MSAGQNEEVEKARAEAVMADERSRIDASEFDLRITITDADGKPLDDVDIRLEWKRPKIPLLSGEWERRIETKKVDSKVRIHEKGWSGLTLSFRKDGYSQQQCKFDINILDEDKSKLTIRKNVLEDLRRKMKEKGFFRGGGGF
ncbi:MAG: hypothetical protein IKQ16_05855 [Lentisphaeria bacterium]|nr:hypothetical protein [Lentisphaeria bacterium]